MSGTDSKKRKILELNMRRHLGLVFELYADLIRFNAPGKRIIRAAHDIVRVRNIFLSDLCTFYQSNPASSAILLSRGLTRREREICCLYGLGLSSKEILSYLEYANLGSFYNATSAIRQKLGLRGSGVNLASYLREKFKNQFEHA